jgi:hypothetical protein
MVRGWMAMLAVAALAGCNGQQTGVSSPAAVPAATPQATGWQALLAASDRVRVETLPQNWSALAARLPAKVRGAAGALVAPGGGLDHPALTPGTYRCRAVALRAPAAGAATLRPGGTGFCYVGGDGAGLSFMRQTGQGGAAGYLHADGDRYVFVGARQRRAGDNSLGYGQQPTRNLVGMAERIGPFRWRLAMVGAAPGAIELFELTPVPADQQPRF